MKYIKSIAIALILCFQIAYAYGGEGIMVFLTILFLLAVGISAVFRKGVGWKYRMVVFFGTLSSMWISLIIVDFVWPNIFTNGPLLTILFWLFLFPLFLPMYYFAEKRLNKGEKKSLFYLFVRHLTRRSS